MIGKTYRFIRDLFYIICATLGGVAFGLGLADLARIFGGK